MNTLLPTAYFPPVSYMGEVLRNDNFVLEQEEHFIKQTIRNRCEILGANGKLRLTIPVEHDNRWRLPVKEIKIRNDEPWKRLHMKSIQSAYGKSPFFEFYADDLEKLFAANSNFLFEWNMNTLELMMKWLKIEKQHSFTTEFTPYTEERWDARKRFDQSEGNNSSATAIPRYHQVFEDRHGFQENLSCLDLIFNTGPEANRYLK